MDPQAFRHRASAQDGLAARWQLRFDGMSHSAVSWTASDRASPARGVYLGGWAPVSPEQRWRAATLTTPDTSLALASAAGLWAIRPDPGLFVTVVRPGNHGPRRTGDVLVTYSATLAGNVTSIRGIRVTTAERTIIDLWPHLPHWDAAKTLREALRLGATDIVALTRAVEQHRRRRGIAALRAELAAITGLPFHRCKSDGEAYGLAVLAAAGVEIPRVNVDVAGEEADFTWPALRDIVEIDGPQWHRFKEIDARKTAAWVAAGFRVRRIPTDLLFAAPSELLRLAPPPSRP